MENQIGMGANWDSQTLENSVFGLSLLSPFTIFVEDRMRLSIKIKQACFSAFDFHYLYRREDAVRPSK